VCGDSFGAFLDWLLLKILAVNFPERVANMSVSPLLGGGVVVGNYDVLTLSASENWH
jgi:hypothetical protein